MEQITVTKLDTDELTMNYLESFLQRHGYPDCVQVSPADFIRLCVLGKSDEGMHWRLCLLGTVWLRGSGVSSMLSWEHHELRSMER